MIGARPTTTGIPLSAIVDSPRAAERSPAKTGSDPNYKSDMPGIFRLISQLKLKAVQQFRRLRRLRTICDPPEAIRVLNYLAHLFVTGTTAGLQGRLGFGAVGIQLPHDLVHAGVDRRIEQRLLLFGHMNLNLDGN